VKYVNTMSKTLSKLSLSCAQTQRQRWSSIFKYFFKSPKKRIIRVCLNRIESMSLLWPKWVMQAHFKHLCYKNFPMIYKKNHSNKLRPLKSLFKNSGVHQNSNSKNGNSLGSVGVHSFTFSYNPKSMICDSQASFLACTFASPCLG